MKFSGVVWLLIAVFPNLHLDCFAAVVDPTMSEFSWTDCGNGRNIMKLRDVILHNFDRKKLNAKILTDKIVIGGLLENSEDVNADEISYSISDIKSYYFAWSSFSYGWYKPMTLSLCPDALCKKHMSKTFTCQEAKKEINKGFGDLLKMAPFAGQSDDCPPILQTRGTCSREDELRRLIGSNECTRAIPEILGMSCMDCPIKRGEYRMKPFPIKIFPEAPSYPYSKWLLRKVANGRWKMKVRLNELRPIKRELFCANLQFTIKM